MKLRDLLKLILQNWRYSKTKTRLVIGAIAIIIGIVALLMSFGFGLSDLTLGRLARHGALASIDATSPDPNDTPLTAETVTRLKAIKQVKSIGVSIDIAGTINYEKVTSDVAVLAANRNYFSSEANLMLAGKDGFSSEKAREVIISSQVLGKLGIKSPKNIIGKEIVLNVYIPDYKQLGTYRVAMPEASRVKVAKKATVIGVISDDKFSTAQIPVGLLGLSNPYYSTVRINTTKQSDVGLVKKVLEDSGFSTQAYGDKFSDARTILFVSRIAFAVLGFLILLIASIVAANTMTISLLEQAREVATLKKLGMSDKLVRKLYLVEALSLVSIGSLLGVVGAFLAGWLLNLVFYFIAKVTGRNSASLFALPLYFIPLVILAGAVVGLVAGFFPSRRAMKLSATKQ